MRFMVQIDVQPLPGDWGQTRRDELRQAENERVVELMHDGKLRALFRIPGRNANFGVWQTETFEELDAILRSLPMHPFMRLVVTPISAHPMEALYRDTYGELPAFHGMSAS